MNTPLIFWIVPAASVVALAVAWIFYTRMKREDEGTERMREIAAHVRKGAMAYLRQQYKVVTIVFVALALLFAYLAYGAGVQNPWVPFAFLTGGFFSGLAGFFGMKTATYASARTAHAARQSLDRGLKVAFRSGAVMGLVVVGLGLLDISFWYLILDHFTDVAGPQKLVVITTTMLTFGMGASTQALFARVGGGIYTKAADVGADLVGKVEAGIPEDDPRNPATIADNVGDNVGDVAGMGADLFDSNVAAMAATIVIALSLGEVPFLFCVTTLGLLASVVGVLCARLGKNGNPSRALNGGTYLTCGVFAALTFIACLASGFELRLWGAAMVGMLAGVIIGITSDFFTGDDKKPVAKVAEACQSGPAFTILSGFSYGLLSALPALVGIGLAALISYKLCAPLGAGYEMLGISCAAIGMLSIVGMIISSDAYGPIVDNARGVAEMADLGDEVLEITDELDAAGNTAKAITKGFSIGAAGLTVIALLGAFREVVQAAGVEITFDLMDPLVFFGMLVGAAIPAVFSAMLIMGVNRNSQLMVKEIHRQFKEIPGLKEGTGKPDYARCIDISTLGAIRELVPAGLTAIAATLLVGFIGGVQAIGGYLTGNIISGLLLALLMSNAGGLWDNAKKYIESGHFGGKGSDAHKAAVIGDTVGDPFKDTAGPSINTQITVVSLVSSLAAVLFLTYSIF